MAADAPADESESESGASSPGTSTASQPTSAAGRSGALYVVGACQQGQRDRAWVSWLGYEERRSCWRSLSTHFDDRTRLPGVDAPKVTVSVRALDASHKGEVLEGRAVPEVGVMPGRPPKKKRKAARAPKKPKAKKKRKDEYETKVHTIRVGSSGVQEIREVRRNGQSFPAEAAEEGGAANGHAASSPDDKSALWAQHRQLNESVYRSSHGTAIRIEVASLNGAEVTLKWTFPFSSPGDVSAWIGLYSADSFDWCRGATRPRYVKFKTLNARGHTGEKKFGAKDWAALEDGEYLFAVDSGNMEIGDGSSGFYAVSQRVRIEGEKPTRLVGAAHGLHLPPRRRYVGPRPTVPTGAQRLAKEDSDEEEESDDEGAQQQFLFPVPLIELEDVEESTDAVKQVYALVEKLSYHDWGLGSKDHTLEIKRSGLLDKETDGFGRVDCSEHWTNAGSLLGENAQVPTAGQLTAKTSEGYGEATLATAERLVRVLANLTTYVPAMGGWEGPWNLDGDATFLDIGSGYGKVVLHVKMMAGCRAVHGIECVPKRVEISTLALQGSYGELDRASLDDDLLRGCSFCCADATSCPPFEFSHVYTFDRVFSRHTFEARAGTATAHPRSHRSSSLRLLSSAVDLHLYPQALAKVLQRSPFYVMISSKAPRVWWGYGLTKIQPVAKMRFKTTGREGCTVFIYVNTQFIPGMVG